jgi:hypothetical protein
VGNILILLLALGLRLASHLQNISLLTSVIRQQSSLISTNNSPFAANLMVINEILMLNIRFVKQASYEKSLNCSFGSARILSLEINSIIQLFLFLYVSIFI